MVEKAVLYLMKYCEKIENLFSYYCNENTNIFENGIDKFIISQEISTT